MPFLQLANNHVAVIHLSKPMGESSKIVPTFTENCLRHSKHVHVRRVVRKERRFELQRGHCGPLGHFALDTASKQIIGSEKYRIASVKPLRLLRLTSSMNQYCHGKLCESSELFPSKGRRSNPCARCAPAAARARSRRNWRRSNGRRAGATI